MIIAIDGPAGAGKSTISKLIANRLGIMYIDTGAMYRAVTYYFLQNDVKFDDKDEIKSSLDKIDIDFDRDKVYLCNQDVTSQIRSKIVNENVSDVSAIDVVREKMVDMQRLMSKKKSVLLDGRDIGTVVFPSADYKFYLTASVDVRAKRRYLEEQNKGNINISIEEIKKSIENRDFIDSNRKISPLKKADDALEIDTSDMSIDEVVNKVINIVGEKDVI
ncbi:cytidylate kinase [Peptoanaerobacter stomatis]|uniref:Cytidylate kinase n=1 Tax=Peptoanaerobacter stomatis TaxID=796937 RepID=J5WHJ1_9FIRM|nr:(d)CMP kinase [Peptoanaerobacter stomatis]EJU22002.1 cytidylate kinase [Peptoanaerobacter stomatis]NWO24825.1 (d)CMP kinase [Peptostreptococcaceae bacterium oral taxon 081]